jgi:hypothetical protein
MPPNRKGQQMEAKMITSALELPGYEIECIFLLHLPSRSDGSCPSVLFGLTSGSGLY